MNTILIIDDSEPDQFYSEMVLEEVAGEIRLMKAYDGQEALEILAKHEVVPDLILLDINMPRMDGHEFLEAWTEGNTRDIPVVVMLTSSNQKQDKDRAFAYKCVKDYMVKPITPESVETLKKLFNT